LGRTRRDWWAIDSRTPDSIGSCWEDGAVTSTLAHVTPHVLRWARESVGYDVDAAADKIGVKTEKLEGAESGDLLLTLRQAERAAAVYHRPLAALFMSEPPIEDPQQAQFRRLPGAPQPPWPPEMQLLARRVHDRQEAAVELYDALDEEPPWVSVANDLARVGDAAPEFVRQLLRIGFDEQTEWHDQSGYTALRAWVDAVESLGVLVMQDGSLPVEMMRGFAAPHAQAPLIVVNTQDDARARAFTIIHELGHLSLAATGRRVGSDTERWCDEFAGEVIMPRGWLQDVLGEFRGRDPLDAIDALALRFGVTPYAAAVRVARSDLWDQSIIDGVIQAIRDRPAHDRGGGGNYYWTQIGRLGPSFIRLVFTALDGQAITYPVASSFLEGVKVSNFDKLREYLTRRTV
jgi:Zn-dependent peptidase ImmA (M78 family)